MVETVQENSRPRDIWIRVLYMLLFVCIYSIAEIVLGLVVVFQVILVIFGASTNDKLLRFGQDLSIYVYHILRFQTFNSEDKPFPFADFPGESPLR
jgi:hypothetical protein